MEEVEEEKGLAGWPWEVPGYSGVCWWGAQGSSVSSLLMDEHIWERWWAALQLHMCLGNNRKNTMSLETPQG